MCTCVWADVYRHVRVCKEHGRACVWVGMGGPVSVHLWGGSCGYMSVHVFMGYMRVGG
jgi:hypothetical protein